MPKAITTKPQANLILLPLHVHPAEIAQDALLLQPNSLLLQNPPFGRIFFVYTRQKSLQRTLFHIFCSLLMKPGP